MEWGTPRNSNWKNRWAISGLGGGNLEWEVWKGAELEAEMVWGGQGHPKPRDQMLRSLHKGVCTAG